MSRRQPYSFQEPAKQPPRVWRSLEEKDADPAALRAAAEAERPGGFLDVRSVTSRRSFMQVSALTAAVVGAEGCVRRNVENIVPYARGPEYLQPGVPLHYASAIARGGDALGVLVTSHEGRPTKVDGNPQHPSSGGATDISAQLSILDLYDSGRARTPTEKSGEARADRTLEQFDEAFEQLLTRHRADGGRGLRFLCQSTSSPSFLRMREAVKQRYPSAVFHTYQSVNDSNVIEGAKLAFGQPVRAVYRFDRASVVVSLDADFLGEETGSVRNAKGFGETRRIASADAQMSRLYQVESGFSITGASADHRLRLAPAGIEAYTKALAAKLVASHGITIGALDAALAGAAPAGVDAATWIDAVAADIAANRGKVILVAGRRQSPRVHAIVHALNVALGAVSQTLDFYPVVDTTEGDVVADLKSLVEAGTQVRTLVVLGGNPVYDAPADLDFKAFFTQANLTTVVVSQRADETGKLATWHCPAAHELETWGDLRAIDGTMTVQQPMIESLWLTRAPLEVLAMAAGERAWRASFVVRETMRKQSANLAVFERDFRRVLHAGVVPNSAFSPRADLALMPDAIAAALRSARPVERPQGSVEVQFVACPKLGDGRHANNLWALELPEPMTRIVWDNAAIVSKDTRDRLGLRNGDVIRLKAGNRQVELPVFALPGQTDDVVTVALGWGRTDAGAHGNGKGFDVHPLRTTDAFHTTVATVEKTGRTYELVQTQEHDRMEGRPIAIDATAAEYRAEPDFASYRAVDFNNGPLWREQSYEGRHKWGMVIDLSACTGCNACVVACQAENNIPTVGKREVARGREMFWIRIDRYFLGDTDSDPQVALQPIGCQHCEEAPCENVCPVNATAHSPEGLNDMAYNRCIGTRYCANNCPYKVRRFNYLDFHTQEEEFEQATDNANHLFAPPSNFRTYGEFDRLKQMQFNPNVTVRMRGVIEKCSYCVQRIEEAKIAARRESRAIGANEVVTACQSVCAPGAIVFGDLNNRESQVAALAQRDRRYKLLAEVGAQPRTTFLAKIRNPNPAFGGQAAGGAAQTPAHEEAHQ